MTCAQDSPPQRNGCVIVVHLPPDNSRRLSPNIRHLAFSALVLDLFCFFCFHLVDNGIRGEVTGMNPGWPLLVVGSI
jgi:hypothetical protein